jgi:hypothetical protein
MLGGRETGSRSKQRMEQELAEASRPAAGPRLGFLGVLLAALFWGGCARSVNDHLAEARSNAPGAVKDAAISIGTILLRKEAAALPFDEADREALLYLKDVAGANPVPLNRAVALLALSKLHRAEAEAVFRGALHDPFWLARLHAVNGLELQPDPSFAQPLRELIATESHLEVKLAAVKALGRIKGEVALKTLLEVFLRRPEGAKDPQVLAYGSIREITGLGHGFDELQSWEQYYRSRFGPLPEAPGMPATPAGSTPARSPETSKGSGAAGADAKPAVPGPAQPPPAGESPASEKGSAGR